MFDLDGVLADTSQCHRRAYDRLWRHLEVPAIPYNLIAGISTHEAIIQNTMALQPSPEQLRQWVQLKQAWARQYLAAAPIAFPDVPAAFYRLRAMGLLLAVATGASRRNAHLVLGRLRLLPFLCVVVTREDVQHGKPAPDLYTAAFHALGIAPDDALVIEDSNAGLAAAIASGAYVAGARTTSAVAHPRFLGSFPDVQTLLAATKVCPA